MTDLDLHPIELRLGRAISEAHFSCDTPLVTEDVPALIARVRELVDCGAACGTVGEQCQACLRRMFHREVERAEKAEARVAELETHAQWQREREE